MWEGAAAVGVGLRWVALSWGGEVGGGGFALGVQSWRGEDEGEEGGMGGDRIASGDELLELGGELAVFQRVAGGEGEGEDDRERRDELADAVGDRLAGEPEEEGE